MRGTALALLVLAAGCGGSRVASSARDPAHGPCQAAASPDIAVCGYPIRMSERPSTIWIRVGGRLKRIAGPARIAMDGIPPKPVKNARPVGFWMPDAVLRSPDGRTLLAQWSGECEGLTAYLVSVANGKIREIFGTANESTAHGWTADGRARVRLKYTIFTKGVFVHAGMYDVDPVTLKRSLERRLPSGLSC